MTAMNSKVQTSWRFLGDEPDPVRSDGSFNHGSIRPVQGCHGDKVHTKRGSSQVEAVGRFTLVPAVPRSELSWLITHNLVDHSLGFSVTTSSEECAT